MNVTYLADLVLPMELLETTNWMVHPSLLVEMPVLLPRMSRKMSLFQMIDGRDWPDWTKREVSQRETSSTFKLIFILSSPGCLFYMIT